MPKFGKTSQSRIDDLSEPMAAILTRTIKLVDFTVLETHRGKAKQNEYFRTGKSKLKWPQSKHNKKPSNAADVALWYKEKPHVRWDKKHLVDFAHLMGIIRGVAASMGYKVRCGFDWDMDGQGTDERWNDYPHVEYVGPLELCE